MKKHNRRFSVVQLKHTQDIATVTIPCRILDRKTKVVPERVFATRKSAKRFCKTMNKLNKNREVENDY